MSEYRITIVVPCFGRPLRTRRIIECILDQNINNWEAFVIGDGCQQFQNLLDNQESKTYILKAEKNGSKLHLFNLDKNYGGWGYQAVNHAIKNAKGEFFIFAGNDDIIDANHFSHYLSEIENTTLDMVHYNSHVDPRNTIRNSSLKLGHVGHSEIIIRTSILRDISQKPIYAADWEIISEIIKKTNKIKKSESTLPTYHVRRISNVCSDKID